MSIEESAGSLEVRPSPSAAAALLLLAEVSSRSLFGSSAADGIILRTRHVPRFI